MYKIIDFIISNIIENLDIISIVFSIGTFLYTWYINKRHLKIVLAEKKCSFYKDIEVFYLNFNCNISNKSRNPINICSIELNFKNQHLSAVPVPIGLMGDGFKLHNEIVHYDFKSISLPIRLESYDGLETAIVFVYATSTLPDFINIPAKITFNTSRGKIKKHIKLSYKN